jgi:hypothetical protein
MKAKNGREGEKAGRKGGSKKRKRKQIKADTAALSV